MTPEDSDSIAAAVPQNGSFFCSTRPSSSSSSSSSSPCSSPSSYQRSVKRKLELMEMEARTKPSIELLARVEIENECSVLREALAKQQQKIQELSSDLEEERNSSYTATNEAMSMILRLQREKAEIQMEARQFKRFAEEKMAHDQDEILTLEELFYKRDQAVQALSYEVQAYRHRLLSFGINPDSISPATATDVGTPRTTEVNRDGENYISDAATTIVGNDAVPDSGNLNYDYPPLRCIDIPYKGEDDDFVELDKYAPGDTPRTPGKHEQLQHIEQRINQMERSFSNGHLSNIMEKGVVMGNSPRRRRISRQLSIDSNSSLIRDHSGFNGKRISKGSDAGRDDASDRVYMIDTVHGASKASSVGPFDDHVSTPRDPVDVENVDIKKLYMRMQALEADRESLKQTIISMRTDSTQLVLLKEIAQNLSKGMAQPMPATERRLARKSSAIASLPCVSLFKWIISFLSWKRKAGRCKHTFGLTSSNVGLLLAIDRSSSMRHRRFLTRRRSSVASPFRPPS